MGNLIYGIDSMLGMIVRASTGMFMGMGDTEYWAREQLAGFGMVPQSQTLVLVALGLALIFAVTRIFVGMTRFVIAAMIGLATFHVILPNILTPF